MTLLLLLNNGLIHHTFDLLCSAVDVIIISSINFHTYISKDYVNDVYMVGQVDFFHLTIWNQFLEIYNPTINDTKSKKTTKKHHRMCAQCSFEYHEKRYKLWCLMLCVQLFSMLPISKYKCGNMVRMLLMSKKKVHYTICNKNPIYIE